MIRQWLKVDQGREDVLAVIPCDSTDAWIVAAYHDADNVEMVKKPWENIISRRKRYHGVRISGHSKSVSTYRELLPQLIEQWSDVVSQCSSAEIFESEIRKNYSL